MYYYIYILSNKSNRVIYTGITNNIVRRVYEHKSKHDPNSFTARYNVNKLVYYEVFNNPYYAIKREKQIKSWNRKSKDEIISSFNPDWEDLYDFVCGHPD